MAGTSTQIWTVGSLLTWTADFFMRKGVDEGRLSAELLLAHVLNCSRMALYTQFEKVPVETELAAFRELVKQRAEHVPVAYLVGKAWFFSLEFAVNRDVLIPRPDTETLVEFVIQHARQRTEWSGDGVPAILDLCTGSGAIAVTLAKRLATAKVTATDLSEGAAMIARENATLHATQDRVTILHGDLFEPLHGEAAPTMFHVIAANPPYIPTADVANLPEGILKHEPRMALDGGLDGMDFHRRIVEGARRYLQVGGLLIMEMQFDQGEALMGIFAAAEYLGNVRVVRDAAGHQRCVVGVRV